jgi:hypothetical protein
MILIIHRALNFSMMKSYRMMDCAALFPALRGFRNIARSPISTIYYAVNTKSQIPVIVKQIHGSQVDANRDFF